MYSSPSKCACDQPPSSWGPIKTIATLNLPSWTSGIWNPPDSAAGGWVAAGGSVAAGAWVAAGAPPQAASTNVATIAKNRNLRIVFFSLKESSLEQRAVKQQFFDAPPFTDV